MPRSRRFSLAAITAAILGLTLVCLIGIPALAQAQPAAVEVVPSLRGTTYIEATTSGATVTSVDFTGSASCVASYTDSAAPFWYKGDSGGAATGFDTTGCADGSYTLTATAKNGSSVVGSKTLAFRVVNGSAPTVPTPTPSPTVAPSATPIPANRIVVIRAAGRCVDGVCPEMALRINENTVATWDNIQGDAVGGVFQVFTYVHSSAVAGNMVWVEAVGDQSGDVDLRVDKVTVAGVDYQSEAPNTKVTGYYTGGSCSEGFYQVEWINCYGGYFAYDQPFSGGTPTPTLVPSPTRTPTPAPSATPTAVATPQRTLVESYSLTQSNEGGTGESPLYDLTAYHPRSFAAGAVIPDQVRGSHTVTNAGSYAGWDFLSLPNQGVTRIYTGEILKVTLNRASKVGILWTESPSNRPSWLSTGNGWSDGGTVSLSRGDGAETFTVYTKEYAAGTHAFSAANDANNTLRHAYAILFAETGGTASTAPSVPFGAEVPLPNTTCPGWLHANATTTIMGGPHRTWHRQIDPSYWCYYRHEHGSDPALMAPSDVPNWMPSFGRSANAAGITENDEGFKGAYFEQSGTGYYVWMHFGTVNAASAACQNFHEVGIAAVRLSDRKLMADVAFMADQGKALENTPPGRLLQTACVNQSLRGGTGARQFPVASTGDSEDPTFYEPWRFSTAGNVVGMTSVYTMNTPDPGSICANLNCDTIQVTGLKGARRFLIVLSDFGIDASRAAATGTFYTNPFGTQVVAPGDAGAVRQFVSPEADFGYVYAGDNGTCYTANTDAAETVNRFRAQYRCDAGDPIPLQGNSQELEASLRMPN